MKPRITVFSFDIPYPPNRGGRADVWRRIHVLKALGCHVQLICWNAMKQKNIDYQALSRVVDDLMIFDLSQGVWGLLKRLLYLPCYPSHVSSRVVGKVGTAMLYDRVAKFSPDVFWVEGVYPTLYLKRLVQKFNIPYFYRSHNVEHIYMRSQAFAAHGRSKVGLLFSTIGLKRYERNLINNSRRVFDVSFDDAQFWKSQGLMNIDVLTPMPESALLGMAALDQARQAEKIIDVLFLGNLATPNNVKGVELLVNEILPLVKVSIPNIVFFIAGSNPVKAVLDICDSNSNIKLLANVPDPFAMMCQSKVLVNPVATGGGVMVKMLDMLMTDQPIVTMRQGLYGLPSEVKDTVSVATSTSDFANQIIEYLKGKKTVDLNSRDKVRKNFSSDKIQALVDLIAREVK